MAITLWWPVLTGIEMDNRNLEIGRCYFLVGYLDRQFKLPFIQSYVFLGREQRDGSSTTWVFQDVHSFFNFGEQRTSDDSKHIDVLALDESGLDTMLDAAGLTAEFERLGV